MSLTRGALWIVTAYAANSADDAAICVCEDHAISRLDFLFGHALRDYPNNGDLDKEGAYVPTAAMLADAHRVAAIEDQDPVLA